MLPESPRKSVVVADHDDVVRFIATHTLSGLDYAVDNARDARELTQLLTEKPYHAVVVSDAIAEECLDRLMARDAGVIITGRPVAALRQAAVVRKPIELDLLIATVRAQLHGV